MSIDPETRVSEILDQITGIRGPWENAAAADDPTVAEFAKRFRNMAADSRFVGTPSDVADELEALMDATDCDGFQFSPTFYAPKPPPPRGRATDYGHPNGASHDNPTSSRIHDPTKHRRPRCRDVTRC